MYQPFTSSKYSSIIYQAAISLNPEDASCYMYLGISLDKLNDEANAQRSFERALEIEE